MKLNNKGFTLIELMVVLLVLGVIMAVVIPNIVGISEQNKITTYAEDAKRFKSTVEYLIRADDMYYKPQANGECVIVNLGYVHGSDYENPPYGGEYLMDSSFVVMKKDGNRYSYSVQLLERIEGDSDVYRGFILIGYSFLEGDEYFNKLLEKTRKSDFYSLTATASMSEASKKVGCTVKAIYYAE